MTAREFVDRLGESAIKSRVRDAIRPGEEFMKYPELIRIGMTPILDGCVIHGNGRHRVNYSGTFDLEKRLNEVAVERDKLKADRDAFKAEAEKLYAENDTLRAELSHATGKAAVLGKLLARNAAPLARIRAALRTLKECLDES